MLLIAEIEVGKTYHQQQQQQQQQHIPPSKEDVDDDKEDDSGYSEDEIALRFANTSTSQIRQELLSADAKEDPPSSCFESPLVTEDSDDDDNVYYVSHHFNSHVGVIGGGKGSECLDGNSKESNHGDTIDDNIIGQIEVDEIVDDIHSIGDDYGPKTISESESESEKINSRRGEEDENSIKKLDKARLVQSISVSDTDDRCMRRYRTMTKADLSSDDDDDDDDDDTDEGGIIYFCIFDCLSVSVLA